MQRDKTRSAAQKQRQIPPPRPIAELFAIASEDPIASKRRCVHGKRIEPITEGERVQAVSELLREFRAQIVRFGRNEITHIDRLLEQGIKDWGLRIFAAKNPVLALEKLLGTRQKRGKRASAKIADRDFQIAVDVVKEMREKTSEKTWRKRMGLEKAAEAVAQKYRLGAERIQKIYKRHRVAARAEVALRDGG